MAYYVYFLSACDISIFGRYCYCVPCSLGRRTLKQMLSAVSHLPLRGGKDELCPLQGKASGQHGLSE